jgi:hypothetical protein
MRASTGEDDRAPIITERKRRITTSGPDQERDQLV